MAVFTSYEFRQVFWIKICQKIFWTIFERNFFCFKKVSFSHQYWIRFFFAFIKGTKYYFCNNKKKHFSIDRLSCFNPLPILIFYVEKKLTFSSSEIKTLLSFETKKKLKQKISSNIFKRIFREIIFSYIIILETFSERISLISK